MNTCKWNMSLVKQKQLSRKRITSLQEMKIKTALHEGLGSVSSRFHTRKHNANFMDLDQIQCL